MENETASKRDQFIALQSEMKSEEDEAMFKLGEILNSPATRKMIKDMQDLKDRCMPQSVAESQIGACIDVPVNVSNWLKVNYPTETDEQPLAPAA